MILSYLENNPNYGDGIAKFFIEQLCDVKIEKTLNMKSNTSHMCEHIIAVGSVLQNTTKYSVVWGAGFISLSSSIGKGSLDYTNKVYNKTNSFGKRKIDP